MFYAIFRAILQGSTANAGKGRQTLCNIRQPNDICSSELTENHSIAEQKNCLNQKVRKNGITTPSTSFDAINRVNLPNAKLKLIESIESRRSNEPHRAQTCQRKIQKQTCTTKRSHVEIQTVTTKTPAPNCNYRQHQKTYSNTSHNNNHRNTDGNDDCINIDTNKTDWYIQLASNCYRNGFQLHVNHLDEWSKHPCVAPQSTKSTTSPFLRLPSSALLPRAQSTPIDSNDTVSWIPDLVVCSSLKSIRVAPHCDQNYSNNTFDERLKSQHHSNLLTRDPNRIATKKFTPICHSLYCNRSINDDTTKLPIIDTGSIGEQHEKKQLNALNAKNNMNSVAIDAKNLHHNLQLLCQANQYNYQNNNLTFNREIDVNGQRDRSTIPSDNNNPNHWIHETNHNSILLAKQIEVRQTTTGDIVSDLIEVFNRSFDVTDANEKTLPQIILSDFSSDQPTPPTTPLFFTVQSARTLPEHPAELQEFQLMKQHQQQQQQSPNQTNPHLFNNYSF